MESKIHRLDEAVINQIAAGEVVENPASIAKELIENSIDAGARRISVSIQGGGQQSLEIEDDGCGMGPEDALLCLERHATSKIRTVDDLSSLSTMGFRGEALASIAAVSHFELRTSDGKKGTFLKADGGKIEKIEAIARNRGTTIAVRSLFFNVPARKKFQKSAQANGAQVAKIIETVALAHPEISFTFQSQCKTALQLPGQGKRERIEAVLGSFPHLLSGDSLWGLFSAPQEAKSHRRGQYLFINRRPVFCPLISRAVQAGYGTRLPESAYPPFVLFLEIDPGEIDVNVHPQKREVRLRDESALFRKIEAGVRSVFELEAAPRFSLAEETAPIFEAPPKFTLADEPLFRPAVHESVPLPFEIKERPLAVMERYFFLEEEGRLKIVDLSGARARILYEQLQAPKERQGLMWPVEIEIEDPEIAQGLEKIGIECRLVGKKRVAVDALPPGIEPATFLEFYAAWCEGKKIDRASVRYCRNARKRYSLDEAFQIWRRLEKCLDPLYDPLGNRIWKEIAPSDLAGLVEGKRLREKQGES